MSSPSEQTIPVTGASGFVASHIIKTFLERGYDVRGTVRSESSANTIKKTVSQYADRLSFITVPDIGSDDAFNEAIKGVSGILHTASPFILAPKDNECDLLNPAVKGTTTNVLDAAEKYNPDISRVVVTSSFAAILDMD
jgi:nucleoside-diphosphate-sugar epimerase